MGHIKTYTVQHYSSVEAMKRAFSAAGSHWFDRETMQFWGSRIESGMRFQTFIVSSEDNYDRTERRYTVRYAASYGDTLSMHELGEFQEHATKEAALNAIKTFIGDKSQAQVDRALSEALAQ